MARVKLNTGFDYYGDKIDYYVQMKRRRFPWWIFLLLLIPLFIWLYKEYEERKTEEVVEEPEPPVEEEDDLPDPVPGCGVHFSRRHLSDEDNFGFGKIFQQDYYSKYVGAGEFPSCSDAFSLGDFHGVAIDKGTRLIVYKEPNFQGDVLCDITGPLLINCSACTSHSDDAMTKDYIPELQVLFPPENRKLEHDFYGDLYLYDWCYGSCKIICEPCQEEEEKEEPQPEQPTYKEGDPLPKPTENCGVHFSGRVLGDKYNHKMPGYSGIFQDDPDGEYVGCGFYPDNTKAFPNAVRATFDAIAVNQGTRLIIYRKQNFEGDEVLNIKGPMLIENLLWKDYKEMMTQSFSPDLQKLFPPERRQWSIENMHDWSYGSCKIICEPCEEKQKSEENK